MSHIYIFTEIILVTVYIMLNERKSNLILKNLVLKKILCLLSFVNTIE